MISRTRNKILNNGLIITIGTLLGYLVFSYLHFGEIGKFPKFINPTLNLLIVLCSVFYAYLIVLTSSFINKIWDWKKQAVLKVFTMTFILSFICFIPFKLLVNPLIAIFNISIEINFTDLTAKWIILSFSIMLCFSLTNFLISSYKAYINAQVTEIKQQKEKSILQFDVLQTQLSPHYLFNSLNTISSLIEVSAETTEKFIRKLVFTYSYILNTCRKESITINEEIKLVYAYLHQITTRFDNGIEFKIELPDNILHKKVPPLAIQTLIENAVKHNKSSDQNHLMINVLGEKKEIIVSNNITVQQNNVSSGKIGLTNLKKRYSLLGDYKIKIKKDNNFTVHIPILND